MALERIEKDVRQFWLTTCGIDTHRRSSQHARHDTPWNAFSEDNVLVCTLWQDMIVEVFDASEQRDRRFVRLGGKMKRWKGPAVRHGREADLNLRRAAAEKLRVVGFEAEPDKAALKRGERKVAHFYLNRAHELQRIFEFSSREVLERLQLNDAFNVTRYGSVVDVIEPGDLFELVRSRGEIPGSRVTVAAVDVNALKEVESEPESSNRANSDEPFLHDAEAEASFSEEGHGEDELFGEPAGENLSTEEYARKCLPILVAHVLRQKDGVLQALTYLDVAERLDRRNKNGAFWARGLGHVLVRVTSMIDELKMDWPESAPYLTTIVVLGSGDNKGLPGAGVKGKWPDYELLTRPEKESKVMREYDRILNFGSRWNDVLTQLGLAASVPTTTDETNASGRTGGWGGGESLQHKALKRYVRENPEIVGADHTWLAVEEYALRSGDEIDVFFKSEHAWIGVEVKSAISDALIGDYERGLYQTVKYKAVLNAQANIDRPAALPTITVLLLLESRLPRQYRAIAERLGVEVMENVKPGASSSATEREEEEVDGQDV